MMVVPLPQDDVMKAPGRSKTVSPGLTTIGELTGIGEMHGMNYGLSSPDGSGRSYPMAYVDVDYGRKWAKYRPYFMPGLTILGAQAISRSEMMHAVVCWNGQIIWDPDPSRALGVGQWIDVTVFTAIKPGQLHTLAMWKDLWKNSSFLAVDNAQPGGDKTVVSEVDRPG